jgi:hypothetical protein
METTEEKEPPEVITSDTENATKVIPTDAPEHKRTKFRKFRAYNTGMWNGPRRENTEEFNRQDDLHRFDAIASKLELTSHQKSRARQLLDDFDAHHFGDSIDHIIFGICVLAANHDVYDGSRYYPNPEAAGDDAFERIADVLNLDRSDQLSAIEKVRSRVTF